MSEKEISEKMQDIMERMKNRREELDMSYQTLADKVGMSKSTLQRYETGNIKNMPVDKLEAVAEALMVSPAYLMGWEIEIINHNEQKRRQEQRILAYFNALSDIGKKKALDNIEDLSKIYSLERPALNAANQRTDIDIPEGTDTSDNDIMDNENF